MITTWHKLTTFADAWGNEALSKFVRAEEHVALNPGDKTGPVAMYRTVNLVPGLLQTQNYTEALCRGAHKLCKGAVITKEWTQRNILLRMSRQRLMLPVRQKYLVDEAALVIPPCGYSEVMPPQLSYLLDELRKDFYGQDRDKPRNLLDFRVVPDEKATDVPDDVSKEAFSLLAVDNDVKGFIEPWCTIDIVEADAALTDHLVRSWERIGEMALGREESIDMVQQKLRDF